MSRRGDDAEERTAALLARITDRAIRPFTPLLPGALLSSLRGRVEDALLFLPVLAPLFRAAVKADAPALPETFILADAAKRPSRPRPANDVDGMSDEERTLSEREQRVLAARPLCRAFARQVARRGAGDVDDLEQEAMALVTSLAERYDASRASFSTFVYAPVQRLCIDKLRGAVVRRRHTGFLPGQHLLREDDADPAEAAAAMASAVATSEALSIADEMFASPDDRLLRARFRLALDEAMRALDDADRKLLALHYFEGRQLKDAAEELGIAYRTAKRSHQQALLKLHAHLADAR